VELKPEGTKLALIEAAGELFAEFGLRGASIRTIAEKASANVAAVNYHFGTKENLYAQVLRYSLEKTRTGAPLDWVRHPETIDTPEKAAVRLRQFITERFQTLLSSHLPHWYGPFLVRSLQAPTPALQDAMNDVLEPDHDALETLVACCNPSLSTSEAHLWAFSILGMITFYVFAEVPIRMVMRVDRYDPEFVDAAAEHVACAVLRGLGVLEHSPA
jgi:AcrR family transcriptional regulator